MAYHNLLVGHDGGVVIVKMARAGARNALNQALITELREVLAKISADINARAMILTGEGDVFCAGDAEFRAPLLALWNELASFTKPLVMAANGHGIGGGFELALMGDAVVIADNAQFWLPEVQWGGIPGGWGTQLLPRIVGPLRARWIILNGHKIGAREMMFMGLATHVAARAEVLDTARTIAAELATRPPTAVAMAKQAIREAMVLPLTEGITAEEQLLQQAVTAPERKAMLDRFAQGHRPR